MTHLIPRLLLLLLALGAGAIHANEPANAPGPAAPVAVMQSTLVAATGQSDIDQRYGALTAAVQQQFDLPGASRLILRGAWTELDTQQQQAFVDALGRLIAANYASRFKPGVGVRFTGATVSDLPRGRAQVQTQLLPASGQPVVFDYLLQHQDGRWLIVNVLVGGVSEIALRSAQYTRQLQDQSFAAVLDNMRAETAAALASRD